MDNHNNKSVDSTWTQHDRSMFLHAVANGPDDIAGRWEEMANAIPGKTPEEVKAYYEAVEHDLLEIEAGRVELPNYSDDIGDEFVVTVKKEDEAVGNLDSEMGNGTKHVEKERKKATPWTEEEHRYLVVVFFIDFVFCSYIRLCYGRKPLQDITKEVGFIRQMGSAFNSFLKNGGCFVFLK
ncbi:putative transcription factor MYB-HB-like family [Helianthus annuus]|nr:putative transcription factor MYB-HB-like family [Helianthus annuus]